MPNTAPDREQLNSNESLLLRVGVRMSIMFKLAGQLGELMGVNEYDSQSDSAWVL